MIMSGILHSISAAYNIDQRSRVSREGENLEQGASSAGRGRVCGTTREKRGWEEADKALERMMELERLATRETFTWHEESTVTDIQEAGWGECIKEIFVKDIPDLAGNVTSKFSKVRKKKKLEKTPKKVDWREADRALEKMVEDNREFVDSENEDAGFVLDIESDHNTSSSLFSRFVNIEESIDVGANTPSTCIEEVIGAPFSTRIDTNRAWKRSW